MAAEVTRNWSEIASGRFQYDRQKAEVAALLAIKKQDILDFWTKIYKDERRMLISEVIPRKGPTSKEPALSSGYESGKPNAVLGINDIEKQRINGEKSLSAT